MREKSEYTKVILPIALTVLSMALSSCGGGSSEKKAIYTITMPHGYKPVARGASADKSKLLQLMNQYRRAKGRAPLVIDGRLTRAAQSHSEAMNRHQQMTHTTAGGVDFDQRLIKVGYPDVACSENIAKAQGAERVNQLWIESPGHRKNMLGKDYTRVGIGLRGRYWTAVYAQAAGSSNGRASMSPPTQSYYTSGF